MTNFCSSDFFVNNTPEFLHLYRRALPKTLDYFHWSYCKSPWRRTLENKPVGWSLPVQWLIQ